MFGRIVTSALFAGCAAGLVAAVLQLAFVQPVLLQAELYESGALVHFQGMATEAEPHAHVAGTPEHGHGPPDAGATPGLGRSLLSLLFTTLVYTAYGLLLVAAMALASEQGARITARGGILWGIAGFVALHLAPAFGLPPEVPGIAAADLTLRQIWWFGTAGASAVALWLIAFGAGWPAWTAGAALLLVPHLIGAPQAGHYAGTVPPELASLFAARALGAGLAAWVVLGFCCGYFWHKAGGSAPRPA